eukprot:s156_g36.t1
MLLLPKAAVDRNAHAEAGRASLLGYFDWEQLGELGLTSPQRESLIKEGARCGDFLLFHHSGESFASTYSAAWWQLVVHKIGEGGFGKVFAATHKITGIMRAVKRLRKVPGRQELHKNELNALLGLDHPHIVKLLEYYDEEEHSGVLWGKSTRAVDYKDSAGVISRSLYYVQWRPQTQMVLRVRRVTSFWLRVLSVVWVVQPLDRLG